MNPSHEESFDEYAANYDQSIDNGLYLTGHSRSWFANKRTVIVSQFLKSINNKVEVVGDFGCGIGDTLPLLVNATDSKIGVGWDTSELSVIEARKKYGHIENLSFNVLNTETTAPICDIIYCNGVFHHIAPSHRVNSSKLILRLLKPGGFLFFWENNPYNLGTRWIMSKIPFDRNAIMLSSREAIELFKTNSGICIATNYYFIFPKIFSFMNKFEVALKKIPIGGQYLVIIRKPE